jgi:Fe-Mn family superoxide dismutase
MTHTILKPQFAYDALEPFFDRATMEIHTEKHHQTYADKLNAALANFPELQEINLPELLIPDEKTATLPGYQTILNMAGGVWNHNFLWSILSPEQDQTLPQPIENVIKAAFDSVDNFKKEFSTSATSLFGSGWTWLVKVDHTIKIMNLPNQDNPFTLGYTPLLALDVWEHAYYLKYQNRRAEYVDNFWHVVNWHQVNEIFVNL